MTQHRLKRVTLVVGEQWRGLQPGRKELWQGMARLCARELGFRWRGRKVKGQKNELILALNQGDVATCGVTSRRDRELH